MTEDKRMNFKDGKVTNSGVKAEGSWEQICGFSRDMEQKFKDAEGDKDSLEMYNKWRPREDEKEEELNDRTADLASLDEKDVEKKFEGTKEEIEKLYGEIVGPRSFIKSFAGSLKAVGRIFGAKSIKFVRWFEREVYKRFMLKFNPYYFDTKEFSVNLDSDKKDKYVLKVNVLDDKMRDEIQGHVREDN